MSNQSLALLGHNVHAIAALSLIAGLEPVPSHVVDGAVHLGGDWDDGGGWDEPVPYLGADYLGYDEPAQLMGADDPLSLLGEDGLAEALLGEDSGTGAIEQLLGRDAAALMGADPRRARAVRAALARRLAAARARVKAPQAVAREGYLPIPETAIAAAATAVINIFPQAQGGIQISRLLIPSNQGTRYMVNDVVVATRSQFFSPGAISAVLCSEVQTIRLRGDVAYPGTIVSVTIQNVSGANQTLQGAAFVAEAREARTV